MPLLALTREISPAIVHCELTHLARTPIDLARARVEHAAYEAMLRTLGAHVERLGTDDAMPDSVFIEDTAVVVDELAVITRPGAESRRAETEAVMAALGMHRPLAHITAPGTLDGGDVLRVGRRIFVGVAGRSNGAGVSQLAALLAPHGYTVSSVATRDCLHLKSAATTVADDLLLLNPAWVDADAFAPLRTMTVDPAEPFAANALRIGDALVYAAEHPRTRERLEAAGLTVHAVPAGELAKAEGAVTCCSITLTTSA
jgi:dimethylargininase